MEYAEILHRCFRCGYCKLPSDYTDLNCPTYLKFRFETYSPGGRMWLLRAWLNDDIKTSPRLAEIFFLRQLRQLRRALRLPRVQGRSA